MVLSAVSLLFTVSPRGHFHLAGWSVGGELALRPLVSGPSAFNPPPTNTDPSEEETNVPNKEPGLL